MIEVRPFVIMKDLEVINRWLSYRDHPIAESRDIPEITLMVYDECGMIASGSIRNVEGNYGIMDSFVTNPQCGPEIRHDALNRLMQELIDAGKSLGMRKLLAFSFHDNIMNRAIKYGFEVHSHVYATLNLSRME